MLTSSQIMLNSGAHLEFINNTGGYVVMYDNIIL